MGFTTPVRYVTYWEENNCEYHSTFMKFSFCQLFFHHNEKVRIKALVRSDADCSRKTHLRFHRQCFSALLQRKLFIWHLLLRNSTWVVTGHWARYLADVLIITHFKLIRFCLSSWSFSGFCIFVNLQQNTLLPAVFSHHSSQNDCVGFCDIQIWCNWSEKNKSDFRGN